MENLNPSQRNAVSFQGKHLLVLAGAGTGKTRTIISRAAYLINSGIAPDRIQILTFTKRAASEIVSRVQASIDSAAAKGLRGSTFHSWCNYLITRYPKLFGTEKFTVIDADDQLSLMKIICGKNKFEYERIRLKPQTFLDVYSYARNTKRNLTNTIRLKYFPNEPENTVMKKIEPIKADMEKILRGYEAKKRERNYLDYDDMLQLVATKLKKDTTARATVSRQYDHILVDEMQDTNPLQWDLLEPFQMDTHLFCVGDDAQSIYSFRGADFRNIHDFTRRVPDSIMIRLEDNYRSSQEILDVSNWLLSQSPLGYNKQLKAVRGSGYKPLLVNVENQWEEASYIANVIIDNLVGKGKSYSDHLVLTRSLAYSRALEAVFIERKIPYITYGGRGFMESAHIKDVFSALRVVNNHLDEIAWMRFLTLWPGVGEVTAEKYISKIGQLENIVDCLELFGDQSNDTAINIKRTLKSIHDAGNNVSMAVKNSFTHMESILTSRYMEDWDQKRKQDFPVLEILASHFSSILEFITECLLDNTKQINNSPTLSSATLGRTEKKDHVIISTIHSAKGLEAEICFVLNVSPGSSPSSLSLGDLDEVEEERRVLYVALTRAADELIITRNINAINARDWNTKNAEHVESYFLHELPDDLVTQQILDKKKGLISDEKGEADTDVEFGMDFS